jgi:exosortase
MLPGQPVGGADIRDARLHRHLDAAIPILAGAVLVLAYRDFVRAFLHEATGNPYGGHLTFVPVFAAALLWLQHRDLLRFPPRCTAAGIAVVGLGLAILPVGYATTSVPAQSVSFVVTMAGVALWWTGVGGMRKLAFVLTFLVLMVPPPRGAVSAMAPPIQHFVAVFSAAALRAAQIPVEQQGVFLLLPGMALEVAEECAGLRFLPILFVFGAAFARAVLPTIRLQLILIAVAIPVAVLANAARVAATSAAAYMIGPAVILGPAHYYIGKVFWLFALLAMIALAFALRARARSPFADRHPRHVVPASL